MFGDIRTAGTAENPLFCLADLCRVLELQVTPTKNRLDPRGVNSIKVGVQTGIKKDGSPAMQDVDMTFVNEKNLYKVIMRSDKPQAEPFQDWVCGEVLPTLRKTGGYIITNDSMTDEEVMAKAVLVANATIEKRNERIKLLEAENAEKSRAIEQRDGRISRLQPKADFADAAFRAEGRVDIGQAAKILGLPFGRNTLFRKLKEKGVLFGGRNEPKQKYVDAGYFELSQLPPIKRDHHPDLIVMKVTCTQKGLAYINHLFGGTPNTPNLSTIK